MRVRIGDIVTRDVSYAARRLRKQPIVLLLMVTSLGVGVGVNITLYSVVHRMLSADWLQAREPEQLVTVKPGLSYPNLQDLRATTTVLDVAGFQAASLVWAHERGTGTLSAHVVSDNYFRVLGVRPLLCRTFDQDAANVNQVVLSYRFWQGRYDGSVAALGQTLTLNGWPMTVVGVLPADFYSTIGPLVSPAVYVPISAHVSLALDNRGAAQFDVLGRLKPGGTFVAAALELGAIDRRMRKDHAVDRTTPPLVARPGASHPFDGEDSSVPGLLVRGVVSAVHATSYPILRNAPHVMPGQWSAAWRAEKGVGFRHCSGRNRTVQVLRSVSRGGEEHGKRTEIRASTRRDRRGLVVVYTRGWDAHAFANSDRASDAVAE